MVLVDTSVWVDVFRDVSGQGGGVLRNVVGDDEIVLTRFNQLELLQGARDEQEWSLLVSYLDGQDYLEARTETWREAARIYFDLRRLGRTVRSPIDCCIAQIAIENKAELLHRNQDFLSISGHHQFKQHYFEIK